MKKFSILERQFDPASLKLRWPSRLVKKIKERAGSLFKRFRAYLKRLLFPLYLFPVKLATYSLYYVLKFILKLILAFLGLLLDCVVYPFRSIKNLLKSIVLSAVVIYLFASLFVIVDYLNKQYGWWGKFFCSFDTRDRLRRSVVRVVGGYSEGSGFFISDREVLTNFHVIADEPSPKIILANGNVETPIAIVGSKDADLAVLTTTFAYPWAVFPLSDTMMLVEAEPLLSAGYPLGTRLSGNPTILRGQFVERRRPREATLGFIQTDITLNQGMSGGPLVDQCGDVVGVNTLSLAGLSLFVPADQAKMMIPSFTDQEITKIKVDPSRSPEDAVRAFYTYLKARRMQEGFDLLSEEYLKKTNFEEWTNRFTDILDVEVIKSERYENTKDTAFVKFTTKNWVDGEMERHYYEGTWQTVLEDGVYKMLKSKILEVESPGWDWFYE